MIGHRNGKTDSVALLLRQHDGGVDSNDLAVQVEQRPAGIPGIDLSGCLNQVAVIAIFTTGKPRKLAVQSADDTDAHGHLAG